MPTTTSEILTSKSHIDPLRDDGYVIYKIGYIHPVSGGRREVSTIWGNHRPPVQTIPYDIDFEFVDFTAGTAKTYTLDLKAQKAYTIAGIVLETDAGTLTINVKIGSTAVTGLATLSATNTLTETAATANNSVAVGNRVYFEITSTYTGSPKAIRGKLLRTLS